MVKVVEVPNPVPQSGGPKVLFSLHDGESFVSRTGKPVSGFAAPLFEDEIGAQIVADEINGPALTEDWEESR